MTSVKNRDCQKSSYGGAMNCMFVYALAEFSYFVPVRAQIQYYSQF